MVTKEDLQALFKDLSEGLLPVEKNAELAQAAVHEQRGAIKAVQMLLTRAARAEEQAAQEQAAKEEANETN